MVVIDKYHCGLIVKPNKYLIGDHLGGFDQNLHSTVLDQVISLAVDNNISSIYTAYVFPDSFKIKNVKFKYLERLVGGNGWEDLQNYNVHPEIKYKNFICSFNGSDHVSRQLLSSILNNQNFFDPEYSSKNFTYDNDWITSHLENLKLTNNEILLYRKFFINDNDFNNIVYSFGHVQYDHKNNIYNLEDKLTGSFLHIVSETLATSYYPFVTEKFLYSIITRGLFLAYAQPGWHKHIETYYGFKLYDTIFDYSFDTIKNPVKRLIRLIETVSKFSTLSVDDWRDLYHLEQDNIEYNYDHYFSGRYKKYLAHFE